MRDNLKYINHLGEVVDFGKENIIINENDFRDYKWTYSNLYGRVTNFTKSIISKKLPVVIFGENQKETLNSIFEVMEKDVLAEKSGKMYVGDYYINGYFFASTKKDYTKDGSTTLDLQFVTDESYWKKEYVYIHRKNDDSENDDRGLGYAFDYPYDYMSSYSTQNMVNPTFVDSNFIIKVYGTATNPEITINSHLYKVNTTLELNEYLAINSITKEIYKVSSVGEKINLFGSRDTANYIFQKLSPGTNTITMATDYDIDIIIVEERSEPKWI